MADNLTYHNISNEIVEGNLGLTYTSILVIPEFVNLNFLIIGIYGMHQGIQISHPIYAILFLNLTISLATTLINICAFPFSHSEHYVMMSNAMNGLSIVFHCNCWCISSIIRYLYIVHDSWIHSRIPNIKHQRNLAVFTTCVSNVALLLPVSGFAMYLGKINWLCRLNIIITFEKCSVSKNWNIFVKKIPNILKDKTLDSNFKNCSKMQLKKQFISFPS